MKSSRQALSMKPGPYLSHALMAASERVFYALVLQGWCASYSTDMDDPGRHSQLLLDVYIPHTGLFALGGRAEYRSRSARWDSVWGPARSPRIRVWVNSHVEE